MAELKRQKDDMNLNEDSQGYCIHRRITGIHTETGADFILPDYMGDIKKMLNFSNFQANFGEFLTIIRVFLQLSSYI